MVAGQLRNGARVRGDGRVVHQLAHRHHPGRGHPDHHRGFAAYAFAWTAPGRALLFAIVVGLLVVPLQMALVPILRLYGDLDLNGTFLGLAGTHRLRLAAGHLPALQLHQPAAQGPDGVGIHRWRLPFDGVHAPVLPLSIPALAAFAIFQFLWVWNDLLVALVYLGVGSDVAVMPARRLNELVGTARGDQWHILTAAAFVTMVVPLIVFLGLQRYFVRGILTGSVKGDRPRRCPGPTTPSSVV